MRNKLDRLWGLVFLAVPVACVWIFVAAPERGWWFPDDVSAKGFELDKLFMMILAITGIAFVITQAILVYVVFVYSGRVKGHKAKFVHTHHGLEMAGAGLVTVILLIVALVQIGDWEKRKYWNDENQAALANNNAVTIGVEARQFEWRITYPGKDGLLRTPDDIHGLNKLHIPADRPVLIKLTSTDVLHSFFLPNFRVKQDAVPGMEINVWFEAKGDLGASSKPWDLVCAELCGWGHYKMKGAVIVHPTASATVSLTGQAALLEAVVVTRTEELSELEETLSELDSESDAAAQRQKLESDRDNAQTKLSGAKRDLALTETRLRLGMDKTWETWLEEAWAAQEATTLE